MSIPVEAYEDGSGYQVVTLVRIFAAFGFDSVTLTRE